MSDPNDSEQVAAALLILGRSFHTLAQVEGRTLALLSLIDRKALTDETREAIAVDLRRMTATSLQAVRDAILVVRRHIHIEVVREPSGEI